ncbi:MAG: hypothetical protein AMS25_17640 [Gemmatimonas sp. SM23_52]|nr:MAG: hypothetical protein AMS25_17640 [Gemmatimonas sp. SM23_52]
MGEVMLRSLRAPDQAGFAGLVAVIATSAGEEGSLRVRAGDEVSAEYRQPDGSVLRAAVSIRG